MPDLRDYIISTFNYCINADSAQLSQCSTLSLLDGGEYNVYITPIKNKYFCPKQDKYNSLVEKAFNVWSEALFEENIRFNIIDTPYLADIKVYWAKANILHAGVQFTEENSSLKRRCLTICVAEMDWSPYCEEDVYHIALHEIGHVFGLGHSGADGDVMSITGKWVTELSQNDLMVLNLAYALGKHKSYNESIDFINHYIADWGERKFKLSNRQNKD